MAESIRVQPARNAKLNVLYTVKEEDDEEEQNLMRKWDDEEVRGQGTIKRGRSSSKQEHLAVKEEESAPTIKQEQEENPPIEREQATMDIFVKNFNGRTFTVTINSNATIADLLKAIEDHEQIPLYSVYRQRLMSFNYHLDKLPHLRAAQCGLVHEKTVHMVLSLKGD